MLRSFLLASLLPAALSAQEALGPDAFDALTSGKTFSYSADGVPYGAEEYGDDRTVEWSFLDGECITGRWFADAGDICFEYEDGRPLQCWRFYRQGDGLRAEFRGDPNTTFYSTAPTEEPLFCLGPEVGV